MKNYYMMYQNILKSIDMLKKPKLLLHVCCAPCSTECLRQLENYFDIHLYYYNPNISPESEYVKRLEELKRFVAETNRNFEIINAEYENNLFEELSKGLETMPEGGARCKKCYKLRLQKTAEYAKNNGFDFFTTTLTISPYKNSNALNEIGAELAEIYGVQYLFSDFKKENGYKNSIELSKKYNLYRQNYCGCKYSKQAREHYENKLKEGKD